MSWKKVTRAKIGLWLLPLSLVLPALGTPVISPIAEVEVLEDVYTDGVGYTVTDPEFESVLLGVTAHSGDPGLIPDENIGVIRAGYSGLITLRPLPNAFGTASITVTVTNPNGASASTVFTYHVVAVNDPPTLDALADMVLTGNAGLHTVPLTGITSGATNELQDLVVTACANPSGILTNVQVNYTSPSDSGTLSFETLSNVYGTVTVTVFVEDGGSISGAFGRTFTVQVNPTNLPPSVSSILEQVTDLDAPKTISFTVGDLETAAENLTLSATSSNVTVVPTANIVFGGSGSNRTATITPAAGQSGITLVNITVTDADGAQAQASFFFTVRPDTLVPVISSQPQNQTAGVSSTAQFSVAAMGEEPLSYQWQHNGLDLTLQTNAILQITNAQTSDAGDYTAVVTNSNGSVTSFAAQLRVLTPPGFTQIVRSNGTAFLSFTTTAGLNYSIEYRNSLDASNWNLLDARVGTGGSVVVSDPGAKWASRFYRLRVD